MNTTNPFSKTELSEKDLSSFIQNRYTDLEQDYNDRVDGVTNLIGTGKKLAGYTDLRRFFEGDHWSYSKEDGTPVRVYNYCRATVVNYVSFLANEPPEDDVPPRDMLDEIEIARSEQVEKLLTQVKEDNDYPVLFAEAVQNQSLLGDCFIFGPYIEWQNTGKEKLEPRVRMKNLKRVENVRILFNSEDYNEVEAFILDFRVSVKMAEEIYKDQMEKKGIKALPVEEPTRYQKESGYQMTTIRIYYDSKYFMAMVGSSYQVLDFVKHNWGFVPGLFVKNLPHPTRPYGVSDIEDILDAQVEYNESASAERGKINQVSVPHIFYSGEGEPVEYSSGGAQLIKLGQDDKIWPDPVGASTAPFDTYQQARKQDIHQLSMISEVFYGSAMTAKATGRALSVLMQGVNNKVKLKQQYWMVALRQLNANILRLIELYTPDGKKLIQGYYRTDIFFPAILIRNVMEEINKFNMKLQSLSTTQKNIGIPNPSEEQKIQKREWNDKDLMIEISRNPMMRMQAAQAINQVTQNASAQGGGNPVLNEAAGGAGRTADESLPISAPNVPQQAPTSGRGAVAMKGSRGR